ncbi:hypothetical protein BDV59DRAFT_176590 [Aspergillus ambiguus]|uniref:uncharacterized protein n=1 Tax=Aspergillus ambiguus TaxID=176160 RepID=UPI003CCD6A6C
MSFPLPPRHPGCLPLYFLFCLSFAIPPRVPSLRFALFCSVVLPVTTVEHQPASFRQHPAFNDRLIPPGLLRNSS